MLKIAPLTLEERAALYDIYAAECRILATQTGGDVWRKYRSFARIYKKLAESTRKYRDERRTHR